MYTDDEMMIHQLMKEDGAFDTDVHEHLSILACLQKKYRQAEKGAMAWRFEAWKK
jgi:hypothetical protein